MDLLFVDCLVERQDHLLGLWWQEDSSHPSGWSASLILHASGLGGADWLHDQLIHSRTRLGYSFCWLVRCGGVSWWSWFSCLAFGGKHDPLPEQWHRPAGPVVCSHVLGVVLMQVVSMSAGPLCGAVLSPGPCEWQVCVQQCLCGREWHVISCVRVRTC